MYCLEHCVCFATPFTRRDAKVLRKKLKELQRRYKGDLKRFRRSLLSVGHNLMLRRDKRVVLATCFRLVKPMAEKDLFTIMNALQRGIQEVMGSSMSERHDVNSCSCFFFNLKKFKPMLPIPREFTVELGEEIGESRLVGLEVEFKKSLIGLMRASVSIRENAIDVTVALRHEFDSLDEVLTKTYRRAYEVARIFVREGG